jgi:PhnB protein
MKHRIDVHASGKHRAAMPHLVVKNAADAIAFYERAFGAERVECLSCYGRIGQAELRIAGARVRLSDEYPETGMLSPQSFGGSPSRVVLRVPEAHRLLGKAVATGAKLRTAMTGTRAGRLVDPFGHIWDISPPRGKEAGKPSKRKGSRRSAR